MTFHQVGKLSEQKSCPPASSSWPGVTAAVLLPSVGEQQKRTINPLINQIADRQVCTAPHWLPSLSEHGKVCHAAKTPRKSWVRSFPGDSAGCAGTGEQQVTLSSGQRGRQAVRCSRLARSGGLPLRFSPKSNPWWLPLGGAGGVVQSGAMLGGQHSSWAAALPGPPRALPKCRRCRCSRCWSRQAPQDVFSSGCVGQPGHGGGLLVS